MRRVCWLYVLLLQVEEAAEEQRVKLVRAMKQGKWFAVLMSNGAPPLKSKWCSDEKVPYDIFYATK